MGDRIRLLGVSLRCRIGAPKAERSRRQRIVLDVRLETGLRRAGKSDDLRRSVDYQGLERELRRTAESGSRRLLEKLAEDLARAALRFDRRIRSAGVTIRKRPRAMPGTREVAVEIVRRRA